MYIESEAINCPYCVNRIGKADSGKHLYIYHVTGTYHCFRCLAHGRIDQERELTSLEYYKRFPDLYYAKERLNKLYKKREIESLDLNKFAVPLTKEFTPYAYNYVTVERGITLEEIVSNFLCVGKPFFNEKEGKIDYSWDKRIIFPFIEDGLIPFALGRDYMNASKYKYKNSKGSKANYLYNIDNIRDKRAIIVEGLISALSAQRFSKIASLPLLGKSISDIQISRIRSKCDTVYLSLDGEVDNTVKRRIAKKLMREGLEVFIVDLPFGKDPDDLKEDFLIYLNKAIDKGREKWL